ncbi:phosphoribosylformylglycinamidine synthase subunit PurL [Conexibacter sp. JD483]|uniref:phosphoribosylformylglycinamidine synthase subunit PurL n=1 Tax=unclassified Conexibacter TaxID=2627773 RepID=UPI00271E789F|nr:MULTISPECIES: phosphoribosylformylglycinamidine synthase subunit PurL [unclassified Conexibacter]MDO8187050.1 phosphoribosylformylglycinamidine synthase subunit PurL [Conexibacter sp. CPCC 205706]MDO8200632.1 phosphoribosylformylglycinamidine synthase subunit PurL [Conexibacter sp. CPCC 205762]MDR9371270.1 phosphoribosylformylglycinamidine synthase subunit PurL [Conexibacter sp. JD483]
MSDATVPAHRVLGLTDAEYDLILDKLGREPNAVELSMFSLMWSEHCAYKHSKKLLGQLPTEGPYLLMGPGENAGAVDVGDGLAIAFKVESHNHPSAVEPFQGAATGVGGILRDIFAVGARPIAVLDSLRFGEPTGTRSRYLLEHAVGGIGHYGNSIGVPTVGGEIYFEPAYEQNCLVNAMALGIAPHDRLTRAAATGPGNVLVLFGALTGRDGIGGASVLASAELDEDDADKRPTVQIGDPFAEKKLLECSLELLDSDLLVSLQDLGAAGLTSSSSEMASKGGLGLDIHVDRVPLREPGMEPFEIMVSESQERMLCVVEPSKVDAVLAVCEKWETTATAIGEVTDSGHLRVLQGGEVVGDMPVPALVDDCPLYDLAPEKPATPTYPTAPRALKAADDDLQATLPELLGSANIASRRPVFEQYDWIVQSRTVRRPEEADAAVLTLPDGSAIAVSIDCSGRRVAADPYRGTVEAVFECAANLACTGAEPLGLTNCLNFGNPEKPHVAWQLTESVRGMADACRALDTPVVGGNVSLYNESGGGPIYPTPVVGLVGRLPEAARAGRLGFAQAGDAIAVIRAASPSLPASELAKLRGDALPDGLPQQDTGALRAAIELVRDAVRRGDVRSAHDVAEGGLAVALSETALAGGLGASIDLTQVGGSTCQSKPLDEQLFGEAPGTFIVSGSRELLASLKAPKGVALAVSIVGEVGGDTLSIAHTGGTLSWTLDELRTPRERGLGDLLDDATRLDD